MYVVSENVFLKEKKKQQQNFNNVFIKISCNDETSVNEKLSSLVMYSAYIGMSDHIQQHPVKMQLCTSKTKTQRSNFTSDHSSRSLFCSRNNKLECYFK